MTSGRPSKHKNFMTEFILSLDDREEDTRRYEPRDVPEDHDDHIPMNSYERKRFKYWQIRNGLIPHDRVCPICRQTRLNSRQWVPPVCKSCHGVRTIDEIPEINIRADGVSHHFNPMTDSVFTLADLYCVSTTTIHRWKENRQIPSNRLMGLKYEGSLIITHRVITNIRSIPPFLGITGNTFREVLQFRRWESGRIPERSWRILLALLGVAELKDRDNRADIETR